jgi:hypothetical protein
MSVNSNVKGVEAATTTSDQFLLYAVEVLAAFRLSPRSAAIKSLGWYIDENRFPQ